MKKSLRIFIFLILALSFLFSFRKNLFAQTLLTDIPKNIVILNPVSHPKTGNTWEIQFTTQGTNDLFISLEDQETLDDIEFKGLYCNDFKMYLPKVLTESTSFVNNYNCNGISTLKYLVHKAGDHTVGIQFGSEKEIAYTSGVYQWSKRLGGTGIDYGNGVTVDSSGNIIVTGYVTGAADLNGDGDSTDGGAESATGYGGTDIFISVYSPDTVSPWLKLVSPASGSTTKATITISLTLDDIGDCRLGLFDEGYDDMADNTDCSGDGTANISCTTPDLGSEGTKNVFVSCKDNMGNKNTSVTNFDLTYIVDFTLPTPSNFSPTSGSTLSTRFPTISFSLNENGDCRASTSDESYADMSDNIDCSGDGTQSISCTMNDLGLNGAKAVYVSCRDTAGNEDTIDSNENLTYTLSEIDPPTKSNISPPNTFQVQDSEIDISFNTDENATCRLSPSDEGYDDMSDNVLCSGSASTNHSCTTTLGIFGTYDVYIACTDGNGNKDTSITNLKLTYTLNPKWNGFLEWSKRLGGTGYDSGNGVTVDSSGNIIVTGYVNGAADLNGDGDSVDGGAESATGYGSNDIFISVFTTDYDNPTGSITINSNDSFTSNPNVSLTLSATDSQSTVVQMMICNDAAFTGCTWEIYGTSKSWTVSTGLGTKTVYVKYMDEFANISEVYSDSIDLRAQIAFSVGPAESTVSTASSPNAIGTNITFTATANEVSNNGYYLIVCSTNSVTAGSGGASPTCGATTYCKNTTAVSSGTSTSCSYTTQATDAWSNTWYAFVCNNDSSTPVCSSANQGSGDSGSPFFVNHGPTFTAVSNNSPQSPGASLTWNSTASDSEGNTVKLLVCKTNAMSSQTCTGGAWCSGSLSASNPTCSYTIASPTTVGSYPAYAFVVDEFGAPATTGSRSSPFTVANDAPDVTNVTLNSGNDIALSEGTTTAVTITATVTDSNGCESISSVYAYAYRSGVAYTGCDTAGEANGNSCYPEITCSEYNNTCVDSSDTSAVYTCTVNIKHYADSTIANTMYPTQTWLASVKATDSGSATYRAEVTVGVEMEALLGASVTSLIDYGAIHAGETIDPLSKEVVISSTGNVGLDHTVVGTNLTCDDDIACQGSPIPVTYQKYSLTSSTAYSSGVATTTSPVGVATHLAKQTSDTSTTKSLWWGISLPNGITPGEYDGLVTLTNVMSNTTYW